MIPEAVFHEFPAKTLRKLTVSGRVPAGKCQELVPGGTERILSPDPFNGNTASMKSPEYHGTGRFRAGLFDLGTPSLII